MKAKRFLAAGILFGLFAPALLIGFSVTTRHAFESWTTALVLPGFLPFGSADPETEMSWSTLALAFGLNAAIFGCLGVLLWRLLGPSAQQGIQPDGPASGGSAG